MKRVYYGGPLDGYSEDLDNLPPAISEQAITRGVIGSVYHVTSSRLMHGSDAMRAVYSVSEVHFTNGILDAVTLKHSGWEVDPQPASER